MNASRFTLPLVSALVALAALPAVAALRAWEPSDYVQTDLVLHYDGIRNAGAAHDGAATVWKDLSPSANDATLVNGPGAKGAWGATGFVFAGSSNLWTAAAQTSLSGDFTMQVACDTKTSTMQGTCSWPNLVGGRAKGASGASDELSIFYHKGNKRLSAKFLNAYVDQYLPSWGCRYATLMRQGAQASLFEGTAPSFVSTSKTGAIGSRVMVGDGTDNTDGGAEGRLFTGTIHSVRIYDKALSNDELAWNRALDEARFHGVPVPESAVYADHVPDAVVATSVVGAEGAETAGAYRVDDDGHTFRAEPFATVGGASYACTGYTLATWNGSAYGAPVAHDGEFARFVAPGDKVRIEWQWAAATGSIAANPYVTDGLVLYYDGEWNAGFGVHDSSATVWKDLSATGNDAEFVYLAPGGGWLPNAYDFQTNGNFQTKAAIDLGGSFTVQMATDSRSNPFVGNTWPWFAGSDDGHFQFYPNSSSLNVVLNADGILGGGHRSQFTWTDSRFLTAMVDATSNILFQTSMSERNWAVGTGPTPLGSQVFTIGGPTKSLYSGDSDRSKRSARTPFHAVRVYTRILSADEIARNRAVDEARFFGKGASATGAVVVQSSVAGLEGREPDGVYFPDGWAFSAGAGTNMVRGIGWRCAGYQLQTWDADSAAWGAQRTVLFGALQAAEWTSPAGTSFPSVRLTWLWEPVSGARTAADYAPADYAAGGLQLHLDGLARGSSATVWSDLSGHGRDATLYGNPSGESHWTDDGYFFASNAVFRTANTTADRFALGHDYTMQTVSDVNFADNHRDSNAQGGTFVSPIDHYPYGSIWIKSDGMGTIQHRTGDTTGAAWDMNAAVIVGTEGHATYLTALRNGNRTALVEGTAYPTTSNTKRNQACIDWSEGSKDDAPEATYWGVGSASAGGGAHPLYGTIKSVRLYDRMLSEDELAWNRRVDEARFFGRLATTNVVLEASEWNGALAAGPYEVFGAHVFEASPSTVDGHLPTHVRVWTRRPDGTWASAGSAEGASYAYAPGAGTVKIQFRATHPLVLVVR